MWLLCECGLHDVHMYGINAVSMWDVMTGTGDCIEIANIHFYAGYV